MADDFQKNILFTAESKLGTVKDDLLELNKTLEDQLTKQKLLELQGKRNTQAYIDAASQVRLTKQAIRDTNKEYDNAVKAINAANNSIQQNRALLSTLTTEYIKLEQTEGKTAASTLKMKANIAQLSETLKAQEKAIGQTNRSVGNYHDSIVSALSGLTSSIPGFQQFATVAQTTNKVIGFLPTAFTAAGNAITSFVGNPGRAIITGFGGIKQSSSEAAKEIANTADATEQTGFSLGKLAMGFASFTTAGFIAAIAAAGTYLSQFKSTANQVEKFFAGVKNQVAQIGEMIFGDKKWSDFSFSGSLQEGADIKQAQIDQKNFDEINKVHVDQMQVEADEYRAKAKDRSLDLADREAYLKKAQGIENKIVQAQKDNADLSITIALQVADKFKKLGPESYSLMQELEKGNIELAQHLAETGQITGEGYEMYKAALEKRTEAVGAANMKLIKQQNDADNIRLRGQNTETKELADSERNIKEAEQVRLQSIARQAEFTMAAYGKELATTDAHYKEMIFKENKFVAEQEKLAKLSKNPAAKAHFLQARDKGLKAIDQLNIEWNADISKHVRDNQDKMYELVIKSNQELKKAAIANIKDTEIREIESVKLQDDIKRDAYDYEKTKRTKEIEELKNQAATASTEESASLMDRVTKLQDIQKNADEIRKQDAIKTEQDILDIQKKAAEARQSFLDQLNLSKAKNKKGFSGGANNPFNKSLEAAQIQQVADQANAELDNAGLAGDKNSDGSSFSDTQLLQKKAIEQKKQDAINDIVKINSKKRLTMEIDVAKQSADAAFQIIQQSMQRSNEAQELNLQRQKDHDLQNKSLTETQKYEVSEKYRVMEGQLKQKEFKQEQELALAKAAIDTAASILKASPDVPLMVLAGVTGALEMGVIASQRAPAYAGGGLHYTSDGRGGVLPGYSRKDNTNAYLRSGEGIVVSEAMQVPWARNLVSAINQSYGGRPFDTTVPVKSWLNPGFATGGVFNNYTPVGDSGLRAQIPSMGNGRMHPDDINGIVSGITEAIRGLPAPVTDVKDINYQQSRNSSVYDRATY